MLSRTITYIDYNDVERTETFLFNLTQAEIAEMELSIKGGLGEKIRRITASKDAPEIMALFKEIVLKSYGEKSPDGRRFIKSAELSREFSQTEAYSILYMELATDSNAATAFVNGIVPKPIVSSASK